MLNSWGFKILYKYRTKLKVHIGHQVNQVQKIISKFKIKLNYFIWYFVSNKNKVYISMSRIVKKIQTLKPKY